MHLRSSILLVAAAIAAGLVIPSFTAFAHPSRPNPARWTACADKALGETCSYEDEHHTYRGTCRQIGDALSCVRNRPIEHR
jgi:hypothetical protein